MAIIYSYPKNFNILPTDIIVGTSTYLVNGKPVNETKNFRIVDLAAAINTGNTLQSILDNGNSATQDITLVGNITTTKIIPGNIQDENGSVGTYGQVLTKNPIGFVWSTLPPSGIQSIVAGTNITVNNTDPLNPIISSSGTGTTPTLQQVIDTGDTIVDVQSTETYITSVRATNIIFFKTSLGGVNYGNTSNYSGSSLFYINPALGYHYAANYLTTGININITTPDTPTTTGTLSIVPTRQQMTDVDGNIILITPSQGYSVYTAVDNTRSYLRSDKLTFSKDNVFGTISPELLTEDVTFDLPNKTVGTYILATTDDIPSLAGYVPTSRTLTINGVGYDLTTDRSWIIATGSGTVTSISTTGLISGGTITSSGTITTSMTTNKLVGRYSTGTGIMEEITIGSGLTLTAGGILNNTATPTGTGYYGAFQDMLTQTLAAANVGQPFLIRTLDEANQVSITANGSGQLTRITPANTGTYNIQWSGQFQNPDNAIHDVNIWFRKGLVSSSGPGTDVVGSNGLVAMPARKSAVAGEEGHVVAGWNFVLTIAAGEYVEFYWMSDSTQVTLQAYAAGSPPPSTASLIVTVTQQAGILAGTGITAINSLTGAAQTLTVGTTGTDFAIVDSGIDHKFNLPTASATNRGALSTTDWTTFNNKQNNLKTFNRTQGVYYFEEFMGGNGGNVAASYTNVVTSISGVGASCVSTASAPNRTNQQGVVLHSTGTTALGVAGYNYGATTLFIGKGTISIETYVTIATLSTSAERFYTQFGYAVPSNWQNTPNAIFFSYDEGGVQFFDGNATPNFKCYTKGTAGTRTFTITTVPVVANQWYKLRIDINAAASSVTFYIDGNLVATHTTNIPAITTPMVLVSQIIKTVGLTARTMYTDYFMYEELFTTAR